MISVDTSVWIDQFRSPLEEFPALARQKQLVIHPFVIGELALGTFTDWRRAVDGLRRMARAEIVSEDDFFAFVDDNRLMGTGLGFVDIHILAAAISFGHRVWAHDKRLATQAERLGCRYAP